MKAEQVNGTIIGGDWYRRVALVAPNGRIQRQETIDNDVAPSEWGKAEKAKLLSQECGDGKPLSDHPSLVASIYGEGSWEVRIWD